MATLFIKIRELGYVQSGCEALCVKLPKLDRSYMTFATSLKRFHTRVVRRRVRGWLRSLGSASLASHAGVMRVAVCCTIVSSRLKHSTASSANFRIKWLPRSCSRYLQPINSFHHGNADLPSPGNGSGRFVSSHDPVVLSPQLDSLKLTAIPASLRQVRV